MKKLLFFAILMTMSLYAQAQEDQSSEEPFTSTQLGPEDAKAAGPVLVIENNENTLNVFIGGGDLFANQDLPGTSLIYKNNEIFESNHYTKFAKSAKTTVGQDNYVATVSRFGLNISYVDESGELTNILNFKPNGSESKYWNTATITSIDLYGDGIRHFLYSMSDLFSNEIFSGFVLNNNDGTFTLTDFPGIAQPSVTTPGAVIPAVVDGASIAADLNNDGLEDLILVGFTGTLQDNGFYQAGFILQNNGDGTFVDVSKDSSNQDILDYLVRSHLVLKDHNNDGLLDITLSGENGLGIMTVIYENLGNFNFYRRDSSMTGLDNFSSGIIEYSYIDSDTHLDAIIVYGLTKKIIYGDGDFSFNGPHVDLGLYDEGNNLMSHMNFDTTEHPNERLDKIILTGNSGVFSYLPKTIIYTNNSASLGIDEVSLLKNTNFFPNPTRDISSIDIPQGITIDKITIFDELSRKIFQGNGVYARNNVDLSEYSNGMYVVQLTTDTGDRKSVV